MIKVQFIVFSNIQFYLKLRASTMKISPFIKLSGNGSAGIIQIDRPEALNAINFPMYL